MKLNFLKKKDPLANLHLPEENTIEENHSFDSTTSRPFQDEIGLSQNQSIPSSDPLSSGFGLDEENSGQINNNNNSLDFNLNNSTNKNFNSSFPPSLDNDRPLTQQEISNIENPQKSTQNNYSVRDVNLELISSKIDVVKALVETLTHKITTLEQKIELNNKRW